MAVNMKNIPEGLAVRGSYQISVTVRGDKAVIDKINSYNIIASVDLSGANAGENERIVSFNFSQYDGNVFEVGSYSVNIELAETEI